MCILEEIVNCLNENEGFISVLISAITAAIAVLVPYRIANQQNKVALYEKRLECYQHFKALQTFCDFVGKYESFEKCNIQMTKSQETIEVDPVYQCQQKYIDVHNLLFDSDFKKSYMNFALREICIKKCLEKDESFFISLQFLFKEADEKKTNCAKDSLTVFLNELFKRPTEIKIDDVKKACDNFLDKFKYINSIESELKKHIFLMRR